MSAGAGTWVFPVQGATPKRLDNPSATEALSHASEFQGLLSKGELVVGFVREDDLPFFYEKAGETLGLEVELAKRFAKSLNLKLRVDRTATT